MAALLPWDALFLAGFAVSGYRTVGRWLKYTDDTAKAQSGAAQQQLVHWDVVQLLPKCVRRSQHSSGLKSSQGG